MKILDDEMLKKLKENCKYKDELTNINSSDSFIKELKVSYKKANSNISNLSINNSNIEDPISNLNVKENEHDIENVNIDYIGIEEFDNAKTKVLKYICYKKRTEHEIRNKFSKVYDKELLDNVIENLKQIGYIDDSNYIERAIDEYIAINNLSITEIKYKLLRRGINSHKIDDYISKNQDILEEYELKSAKNIAYKKQGQLELQDLKLFLMKKGYRNETIKQIM